MYDNLSSIINQPIKNMAIQAKVIKEKIKSVGNIKKITKTMEMVSVSKMRRAISDTLASREYARYALELLVTLSKKRQIGHPLLLPGSGEKTLLVIVASNKGLCGGYNTNVSKLVSKFKKDHDREIEAVTIGKQAENIAHRNGLTIKASYKEFGEDIEIEKVKSLRKMIQKEFLESGEYNNVQIIYTQFVKQLDYRPKVREIIPISPKTTREIIEEVEHGSSDHRFSLDSLAQYLFEPTEEEVLNGVLPSLISSVLFQILLEASASEHSSRMVAMQSASENAEEMEEELTLTFNRARQAGITQEISEIISGASALQN
jgi:F-type H+-transporting ATPase subunit gamma